MKNLLYLLLALTLVACTPKATSTSTTAKDSETTTTEAQVNPSPQKPDPKVNVNTNKFRVSGTVTYTANYCGGAAPSEEMLAEMRQPKPRFGQELLVRSGDFNSFGRLLARATTKEDGSFEFFLAPGDYCIVIAQKESADMVPKSSEYIHVDTECYNKWMATCDLSFRLADREISGLSLNLHQACFTNSYSTCVQWDGPMPPSAPRRDHE